MTLFELLTSSDINNVRLSTVIRDMFTAEDWARAVWNIYQLDCNLDSTSLWSKRHVIEHPSLDLVHGCVLYLNALPVIEVTVEDYHELVFTAWEQDGTQAIIKAIEKAAYHEAT